MPKDHAAEELSGKDIGAEALSCVVIGSTKGSLKATSTRRARVRFRGCDHLSPIPLAAFPAPFPAIHGGEGILSLQGGVGRWHQTRRQQLGLQITLVLFSLRQKCRHLA